MLIFSLQDNTRGAPIIQSEWYHYQLFWHDFAIYNQQSYQKRNSPGATLCSLAKVLYSNEPKRYCWYSPDSLQTERDTESLQRIQNIICISNTCTYIELSVYILLIQRVYVYRCDCLPSAFHSYTFSNTAPHSSHTNTFIHTLSFNTTKLWLAGMHVMCHSTYVMSHMYAIMLIGAM